MIADITVASNNHKLLAKFHFGTLRIKDTIRLMSFLFSIIARTPIRIRLNKFVNHQVSSDFPFGEICIFALKLLSNVFSTMEGYLEYRGGISLVPWGIS